MKKSLLTVIFLIFVLLGALFFAYQQAWIMISLPSRSTQQSGQMHHQTTPKTVTLWFWKNNKWLHEKSEMIYTNDTAQNMQLLCNIWLQLLEEEHITDKQTTVQSVSLNKSRNEAFISFNQNFLNPQASTYDTCMLIEGLLKTIRHNNIVLSSIRFLVHHQTIQDDRLNFEISWPITGYISS